MRRRGTHPRYLDHAWDFLAAYVVPEDLWYIIPWHIFDGQASVELRPSIETSKYAIYQGAWELMKQALQIPTEPEEESEPFPMSQSSLNERVHLLKEMWVPHSFAFFAKGREG